MESCLVFGDHLICLHKFVVEDIHVDLMIVMSNTGEWWDMYLVLANELLETKKRNSLVWETQMHQVMNI